MIPSQTPQATRIVFLLTQLTPMNQSQIIITMNRQPTPTGTTCNKSPLGSFLAIIAIDGIDFIRVESDNALRHRGPDPCSSAGLDDEIPSLLSIRSRRQYLHQNRISSCRWASCDSQSPPRHVVGHPPKDGGKLKLKSRPMKKPKRTYSR